MPLAFYLAALALVGAQEPAKSERSTTSSSTALATPAKALGPLEGFTFYSLPRAHQDSGFVVSSAYNISALKPPFGPELFGNPNREFPWALTAGLETCPAGSYRVIHGHRIPQGQPITWWTRHVTNLGQTYPLVEWAFPADTVFLELLQSQDSQENWKTWEVRTRTKAPQGHWEPEVWRPYTTWADLRRLVGTFPDQAKTKSFLEAPEQIEPFVTANQHAGPRVINRGAAYLTLPPLPEEVVQFVLAKPFKPTAGTTFAQAEGYAGYAPTREPSASRFGIVPPDYNGGYLRVSVKSCGSCHETVGTHAVALDARRDWYGHVRGSDRIFSWHPFDQSSISPDGFHRQIRFRPEILMKRRGEE